MAKQLLARRIIRQVPKENEEEKIKLRLKFKMAIAKLVSTPRVA
jgi:hypothetical protein